MGSGNCLRGIYGTHQRAGVDGIQLLVSQPGRQFLCLLSPSLAQLSIAAAPLDSPLPIPGSLAVAYQYEPHISSPPV